MLCEHFDTSVKDGSAIIKYKQLKSKSVGVTEDFFCEYHSAKKKNLHPYGRFAFIT